MHPVDTSLGDSITQRNVFRIIGSGVQQADLPGNAAMPEKELQLPVIRGIVHAEEEFKPLAHHDVKSNPDKRNPDFILVLQLFLLPHGLMLIYNIRYALFGHADILHSQVPEILPAASQAALQDERIPCGRHTLRNRRRYHQLKFLHRERQRITYQLRVTFVLLLLHPRHIGVIGRNLQFSIADQISPEHLEMNQHLAKRLFLQPLLGPVAAVIVIPWIQVCILRISGIQILIYTELLKVGQKFSCKGTRDNPLTLADFQETVQLPG